MGFIKWFCRCIPGFALLLWILVCYEALSGRIRMPWSKTTAEELYDWQHLTSWQLAYLIYSVLCHICACIIFPTRLCWAVFHISQEVQSARYDAAEMARRYEDNSDSTSSIDDKASLISTPLSSTGSIGSNSTLAVDYIFSRATTPKYEDAPPERVIHAIILPSYKEDMQTMQDTISVLASHAMAKSSYDLYLAMEVRDPDGETTAKALIAQYEKGFRTMSYTMHPGDIVGEVAGKSSNVSWAARQLSNNYTEPEDRRNVVITVMDSDTHLSANYFLLITKMHLEDADSARSIYAPPVIFDRNSQTVNALVRTADIFWCGAGLSGLFRGSSIKVPTSVYSVAMSLAGAVGGWDTGPESIGEDMHMFLKCYFALKGQANVKVVFSPASQCNVHSDVYGVRGIFVNCFARYNQAIRHMWGSLDTGYAIEKGLEALFVSTKPRPTEWISASMPEDRVPRWVNSSNLTHFTPPNTTEEVSPPNPYFSKLNLMLLYHRLYEAHFLPAHLTVALFSAVIYSAFILPKVTHPWFLTVFSFCGTLRFIGFCLTACYVFFYETYHRTCVRIRSEELQKAGLFEQMRDSFAYRSWRTNWVDYLCLPVTGMLYGTMPAVAVYIRHFFTDKLLYTVSAKPMFKKLEAIDKVLNLA